MFRLEGTHLPEETRGQVLPLLLGTLLDVPGLWLQTSPQDVLREDLVIVSGQMTWTLKLSNPDVVAAVTLPATVQAGNQRFTITAKDVANVTLTATWPPGSAGTIAAGTAVYIINPVQIAAFGVAPTGFNHRSVLRVKLDGKIKDAATAPTHTVYLHDVDTVKKADGTPLRVLTVHFDASTFFGLAPPPASPVVGTVLGGLGAIAGGSSALDPWWVTVRRWARRRWWRWRTRRARPFPISGGAGFGTTPSYSTFPTLGSPSTGGGPAFGGLPPAPIPPPPPPPPVPPRPVQTPTTPTSPSPAPTPSTKTVTIRQFPAPLIGRVSIDVEGLEDVNGAITATPGELLTKPADVTRFLLQEGYEERDAALYDLASFHATRTAHANLPRPITWATRFAGMSILDFLYQAGLCGLADCFVDTAGRWRYIYRDPDAATVATLTEADLVAPLTMAETPASRLATILPVSFGSGVAPGAFVLDSPGWRTRYGPRQGRGTATLAFIHEDAVARYVSREWLGFWDHPRKVPTITVSPRHLALEKTDRILLDAPLVNLYGLKRTPYECRARSVSGEQVSWVLLELDPAALALPLYGSLGQSVVTSYLLFGDTGGADTLSLTELLDVVATVPGLGESPALLESVRYALQRHLTETPNLTETLALQVQQALADTAAPVEGLTPQGP